MRVPVDTAAARALNVVRFVSVDNMMRLVHTVGIERFIIELADCIRDDFLRWPQFDKIARVAAHSQHGVIELRTIPACEDIDLLADPDEPRDLFGMLLRANSDPPK